MLAIAQDAQRVSILVVDDDPVSRELLRGILAQDGYEIILSTVARRQYASLRDEAFPLIPL